MDMDEVDIALEVADGEGDDELLTMEDHVNVDAGEEGSMRERRDDAVDVGGMVEAGTERFGGFTEDTSNVPPLGIVACIFCACALVLAAAVLLMSTFLLGSGVAGVWMVLSYMQTALWVIPSYEVGGRKSLPLSLALILFGVGVVLALPIIGVIDGFVFQLLLFRVTRPLLGGWLGEILPVIGGCGLFASCVLGALVGSVALSLRPPMRRNSFSCLLLGEVIGSALGSTLAGYLCMRATASLVMSASEHAFAQFGLSAVVFAATQLILVPLVCGCAVYIGANLDPIFTWNAGRRRVSEDEYASTGGSTSDWLWVVCPPGVLLWSTALLCWLVPVYFRSQDVVDVYPHFINVPSMIYEFAVGATLGASALVYVVYKVRAWKHEQAKRHGALV